MTPVTARELAELVIEVLDLQKVYFKDRRYEDLIRSKDAEAKLRRLAKAALEEQGTNLFNQEG